MKVAITDYTFPDLAIEEGVLKPLGIEVVSGQCKTVESLIPLIRDADAIITQFSPVNEQAIAAMQRVKAIVRYGIGVDNIDIDAARERKIPVCNVPEYCIDEVADQTLAFILAATRHVVANSNYVRGGAWGFATPLAEMKTLRDLTVGIVGFGRIGREVAARLSSFKCRRIVFDPIATPDAVRKTGCEPADLPTLLSQSDVVTLHCPATKQTKGMMNAEAFRQMKPRSILVNTARGTIVDTPALIAALRSGHLSAAALDVFDPEPVPKDSPLLKMDNVVVAAHIASVSDKAVRTLRETAAKIAGMAVRGEPLTTIVNGVASPS